MITADSQHRSPPGLADTRGLTSHPSVSRSDAMSRGRDALHAAACAAVVLGLLLLAWPWIDLPFNDDWSFAFTVKRLLVTGHLLYNHWSALPIVSQAYWGWLWTRTLGFSFAVLRWSTLPLALGCVALTHALARRAGLTSAYAAFVALLIGTSPLFLPYAASFMTDVPGLFFILAGLYAFVVAAEADSPRATLVWLVVGTVAGLVGGSGRQSAFLLPLVVLPYVAWLKRSRPGACAASVAAWAVTAAGMVLVLHWFAAQPNSLTDVPLTADARSWIADPLTSLRACMAMLLTVALLVSPALLPGGWLRVRGNLEREPGGAAGARVALAAIVLLAVFGMYYVGGSDAIAPWMDNTLTANGVLGPCELYGIRPTSLSIDVRVVITLAVIAMLMLDARLVAESIVRPVRSIRRTYHELLWPAGSIVMPAYGLFLIVYAAALLPRCARHMVYDRYLLPILPAVAIAASVRRQRAGSRRPPVAAWALLGLFALFATAGLQEVTALGRVRIAARDMLLGWGIKPAQIEMGFEFDGWAQLLVAGRIDQVPLGGMSQAKDFTPDVRPIVRLESGHPPFTRPLMTLRYFSWLPPFDRTVYLDWVLQPKLIAPGSGRKK